jgi:hypothetical protein
MHGMRETHVNRVIQKRANREMNEMNARNGTNGKNANCGNHVVIEGYHLPHVPG